MQQMRNPTLFPLDLWHACRTLKIKTFIPENLDFLRLLNIEIISFRNVTFVQIKTLETLNLLTSHVSDPHTVLYPAISDPARTRTGSSGRIQTKRTHRFRCRSGSRCLGVWSGSDSLREDGRFYPSGPQLWRQRALVLLPKSKSARRERTGSRGGV